MAVDLRRLLIGEQEKLERDFTSVRDALDHPGAKGDGFEAAWTRVIGGFLPRRYAVGRAFVVDADGKSSDQIDLVIHDRQYCPLFFKSGGHLYLPAESVYAVFEVKPELSKETIDYAAKKIESVRALRRTSGEIPYAAGEYERKPLFDIMGGILAGVGEWQDPLGPRLEAALADAPGRLQMGCTFKDGAFDVDWDGDKPELVRSEPDAGLIFFLMRLFTRLRAMATVPAIQLEEYARHLERSS